MHVLRIAYLITASFGHCRQELKSKSSNARVSPCPLPSNTNSLCYHRCKESQTIIRCLLLLTKKQDTDPSLSAPESFSTGNKENSEKFAKPRWGNACILD